MSAQSMQGKVVLITGATDGVGEVTAREIAARGATVIVHGRNPEKTARVVGEITAATGNIHVEGMVADLSIMAGVRDLAAQFRAKYDRLDVLVNNAGAIFFFRKETADGLEMTFALNHMAYFLLTVLLLDMLKASAPARIVNVASGAHHTADLDLDDLQARKSYNARTVYGNSKLMNILFTYELARRLEGTGVTANALHPGMVKTQFAANNLGILGKLIRRILDLMSIGVEEGAATQIYLATSPEAAGVSGQYFNQGTTPSRSSDVSYDEVTQRRLWELSAAIAGVDADI